MKRFNSVIGPVCVLLIFVVAQNSMAVEKVSRQEETGWLRWVIPLPKKIHISSKIELPAADVKISLRRGASDTEKTGADQLIRLFKEKSNTIDGRAFDAGGKGKAFEILIGVCDARGKIEDVTIPGAADLVGLPNSEQAYRIHPVNDTQLVLTALDERGAYYAVQTLCQLLESNFSDGNVTIPLVSVTDWPDMEQRGEWGGISWFPPDEIEWMAHHKMNMLVYGIRCHIREDGRGDVTNIRPERIESARRHAFKLVPFITHYSILGEYTNLFEVYPHLNKGKVKFKGKVVRDLGEVDVKIVPCPSEPKMAEVLADFMCALAKAGATEVDCWLTEGRHFQCPCDKCLAEGEDMHYALETRAYIKGWRMARKQYPKLFARIVLTQGSYTSNDKVLAEVPQDVGVIFYASWATYNSLKKPMIYPLLDDFAAKGRWLGVCPQLTSSFGAVAPWTAPQFIRYRMNEFVDKKLKCLDGYAVYSNRLYDFNVTAAAEWSWNAKGRDERAFAAAYATRRGIRDPDAFADWAVLLGPVGWDFYGPAMYDFNNSDKLVDMVAARADPGLGKKGMFEYFPTMQRFDEELAVCEKAMKIAKRLGDPATIAETRVIEGYVRMMKEVAFIATQISSVATLTYDQRVDVQDALTRLGGAGIQTVDGLEQWIRSLPDLTVYKKGKKNRYSRTLASISKTVYGISDALAPFGIRGYASSYFRKKVGAWKSENFNENARITTTWDVTNQVLVTGVYEVTFKNGSHYGLDTFRAALASAPADRPDQLTELSIDEHKGQTAYRTNKAHIYTLPLDRLDPGLRYFLVADIEGHSALAHDGKMKYCKGDVWMRALRPRNLDPGSISAKLLPLTDDELRQKSQSKVPVFTGTGLRVGVLQSGWGSGSILTHLRTLDDIDAEPVEFATALAIEPCQVLVLPQQRVAGMGKAMTSAIKAFVRAGGGLVATHDAAGYRGHPPIITDVCAKGVAHVRDTEWIAIKEHPVTEGIELHQKLSHSYYDHIELEPGPQGVVLAKAARSGKPVVVAGAFGKGRYVACGMITGMAPNNTEIAPTGAEGRLLENAVKWCGRQSGGQ